MRHMHHRIVVVLLAIAPMGAARADDSAAKELSELGLTMATDGRGGYVAFRRGTKSSKTSPRRMGLAYVGDGTVFHPVALTGEFATPTRYNLDFLDRRFWKVRGILRSGYSSIHVEGRTVRLVCGFDSSKDAMPLTLVESVTAAAILKRAKVKPIDRRRPHALARDGEGNYYYVDQSAEKGRAKDFHLYIGRRGRMKRATLRNVVADPAGLVLSSKRGRLTLGSQPNWTEKRAATSVTMLSVESPEIVAFIYGELGVYLGKKLGTPCDLF